MRAFALSLLLAAASSSSSPNVRQIHGRKGEVWTPESGAEKLVVYHYENR